MRQDHVYGWYGSGWSLNIEYAVLTISHDPFIFTMGIYVWCYNMESHQPPKLLQNNCHWHLGKSMRPQIQWKKHEEYWIALQWRHNGHDGVSNHQAHHCLLNRLVRRRSKKTSKLRVTGLCVGNSPVTGEFPAQRSSYAENVSIWWRHHEIMWIHYLLHTVEGDTSLLMWCMEPHGTR